MSLQDQIRADMQTALRAKNTTELDALRALITALTNESKTAGKDLVHGVPDETVITLIRKEIKKRKEAAEIYKSAGRTELAQKEEAEQAVFKKYLPPELSEEEVMKVVMQKKTDLGFTDKKDAGILMGRVMKELQGKVDGSVVKAAVDKAFS